MDGQTYSFEQKLSHHIGKHSLKFGARYGFNGGFRSNPENPNISFQNKADFLANIPSSVTPTFGSPSFTARMYDLGYHGPPQANATKPLHSLPRKPGGFRVGLTTRLKWHRTT